MALRSADNTNLQLNISCECGRAVPVPEIIIKGYEQTIALQQKHIESLEADKRYLQDALGKSITNSPQKNIDAVNDDDKVSALTPSQQTAYQSCQFAESKIGKCTDREAYDWLREEGPQEYDLPAFDTWRRYVRAGRKLHGAQKNTSRKGRIGRSVIKGNEIESLAEVTSQCKQKAD